MLAYQPPQSIPVVGDGGGTKCLVFHSACKLWRGLGDTNHNQWIQAIGERVTGFAWRFWCLTGFAQSEVWRGLPNHFKFDGVCQTILKYICHVLTLHFFQNLPHFEPKWPLAPHLVNLVHVLLWDLIFQKGPYVEPQACAVHKLLMTLHIHLRGFLSGFQITERKGQFFKQFRIKKSYRTINHTPTFILVE